MRVAIFYISLFAFGVGVGSQTVWPLPASAALLCALLALALILIGRRFGSQSSANSSVSSTADPHKNTESIVLLSFALLFFALGVLRLELVREDMAASPLEVQVGTSVTLTGTVIKEPDVREKSRHMYIKTDTDIVLAYVDRFDTVAYGDRVTVSGELTRPASFTTDLGRTFEYPGYLLSRGVAYTLVYPQLSVIESGTGNSFITSLLWIKGHFMAALEKTLPEPQVGLAEGLLLGVKQALGSDLEKAFRQTGIIHIVVLSGYNVMLVVAFVTTLLALFLPPRARLVGGLLAIISFALLVGLSATVVRASIMAGIFLIATTFGRQYHIMRVLLLSAALMILINPYLLIFDPGFQLSFLATLGLIVVAPQFETLLARVPGRLGVRDFFIATIATQIAVLPLLLYQIGELSIVAVIVNVFVLPVVPVAMLLTFATGIIALFSSTAASLVAYPTYLVLSYILVVAEGFAALPFAAIAVPVFSFWLVPISYLGLGSAYWYWRSKKDEASPVTDGRGV